MCAMEYFEEANRNNLDSLAIDCEIQGNFTFKQFENEYKKIAASLYAMTSAKGKISLFVLPPMALESMLIYAHNIIGGVLTGLPPQATTKEICMAINELHIDKLFIFEALLTDEREKEIYENTGIKYIIYYGNSTSSYGDVGMIDKDGFVYIKGRITRTIFVFPTAKVYPSAIEDIISNVSGVKEVVIGQIPDSEHEGFFVPICFIVAFSNYEVEAVIKNIHVLCEESLPKHARPQKILLYEQFPLLPSGKPDIEALERKVQQ